ncbi:ABC transporter ATP-binding protein [Candidatus Saccharibacteria bacterium]|nr:ABC transporter ATP-binding protein [Candidatus Saccharibacteria bacterium]MBQ6375620.1 ABC transporter ATP-binding protein [Candidatus Saccharibacteria bacterium]
MKRTLGTRTEVQTDSPVAISVKNLHKSFKLPTEQAFGLKQAIFNRLRGIKGYKEQKVLKGLDFEIKKGEFVGIVGRNGSGKSTLLKILAGIYYPEKGDIIVNGNLVPFIELGVGFNPELTGRENVYMNGALLGFSNTEMDAMYDDIWEFAELKPFQDQKLKNYSSGMQVRLAFSIAIRARGDILLLDEVLAVGDAAFQQKCNDYFKSLHDKGQTVILVTHSMDNVRKFCSRAILIESGEITMDGAPDKVATAYNKMLGIREPSK